MLKILGYELHYAVAAADVVCTIHHVIDYILADRFDPSNLAYSLPSFSYCNASTISCNLRLYVESSLSFRIRFRLLFQVLVCLLYGIQ